MSDKVQLRDLTQPCEHGWTWIHEWEDLGGGHQCPGGRELTATEMNWCSTHGELWRSHVTPCPGAWIIETFGDEDPGECVRSPVLIVEEQH